VAPPTAQLRKVTRRRRDRRTPALCPVLGDRPSSMVIGPRTPACLWSVLRRGWLVCTCCARPELPVQISHIALPLCRDRNTGLLSPAPSVLSYLWSTRWRNTLSTIGPRSGSPVFAGPFTRNLTRGRAPHVDDSILQYSCGNRDVLLSGRERRPAPLITHSQPPNAINIR